MIAITFKQKRQIIFKIDFLGTINSPSWNFRSRQNGGTSTQLTGYSVFSLFLYCTSPFQFRTSSTV